jgi:acyl-lipid Delta6-acetylenase / acyl-lipid (9-3)-desaturase
LRVPGWLAHDFSHHQVFKTRRYNDYVTMIICCIVGFSIGWWKNQHNTHHAIPNLHESLHGELLPSS